MDAGLPYTAEAGTLNEVAQIASPDHPATAFRISIKE